MADDAQTDAWRAHFDAAAFAAFNPDLIAEGAGDADALEAFRRQGVDRLARFSFDRAFDAAHVRETHPEWAREDDRALYRRWLDAGLAWPASELDHLRALGLSPEPYPAAFDWRRHLAEHPRVAPDRWSALEHLLGTALPEGGDPAQHAAAPAFLLRLADRFRHDQPAVAGRLYTAARAAGAGGYNAPHLLGDALGAQARWAEAADAYAEAAGFAEAGVWTFTQGARAAAELGDFDRAFALLLQGRDRVAGDALWRRGADELIAAELDAALACARADYADGRRAAGDARVEAAAARVAHRRAAFDPPATPLPAAPDGRVLILANRDLPQCTRYRVDQKVELLARLGRPVRVFDMREDLEAFVSALPGAAAAIVYRVPARPGAIAALLAARRLGVPLLYDLDDLVFDAAFPEPLESYAGALTPAAHLDLLAEGPLVRAAIALCDVALGATPALVERMRPLVRRRRARLLPNGLDRHNLPALERPLERLRRDDAVVMLIGSGSPAHAADLLALAVPALLQALERRPEVRLVLAGHRTLDARFDRFADRIARVAWTADVEAYAALLAEVDVNLAVLAPGPVTDAKSEIRWLEAAALGVPSIVGDTARYREVVEDGVDGLIAGSPAAWTAALERLTGDPALRTSIGAAARRAALRYAPEHGARAIEAALGLASDATRPHVATRGARPARVLLASTTYAPQGVGGAARVVQDNLDRLRRNAPGGFDFAVLTGDIDGAPPYALRVDEDRGAPVFRIATPPGPNEDWRPFDDAIEAIVADLLASWRPDVVHLHALQRLTASVARACLRAGVPYLVTLHDAWWVSDWPFLVDAAGRPRDPGEFPPAALPAGVGVGASLARRRALRPLLASAEARISVSDEFAALHRACGIDTVTLANDAPALARRPRTPGPLGRVRLAFLGGQAAHKGWNLVRAALMTGGFAHLDLTAVIGARFGGHEEHETWGTTPVRLVGKPTPERMPDFYAAHDVLLAPSTWPESYGLVTREAARAGLWVVAGNRGAIGADVRPGVDGWVIDVADPRALRAVLREIDADPARYARSPPCDPRLAASGAQALALAELYRSCAARQRRPAAVDRPMRPE